MKTITYLGQDFTVADHINFLAADDDGTVCGYTHPPRKSGDVYVPTIGTDAFIGTLNKSYPVLTLSLNKESDPIHPGDLDEDKDHAYDDVPRREF